MQIGYKLLMTFRKRATVEKSDGSKITAHKIPYKNSDFLSIFPNSPKTSRNSVKHIFDNISKTKRSAEKTH